MEGKGFLGSWKFEYFSQEKLEQSEFDLEPTAVFP